MGLKYDPKFVEKLMGKNVLELSSTYQAMMREGLEKGRQIGLEEGLEQGQERGQQEHARATILRQGRRRLGEPPAPILTELAAISDLEILEQLLDRALEIETWDELLAA